MKGKNPRTELAAQCDVHGNILKIFWHQFFEGVAGFFDEGKLVAQLPKL